MEIYYSRRALLKRLLGEIATAGVLGALLGVGISEVLGVSLGVLGALIALVRRHRDRRPVITIDDLGVHDRRKPKLDTIPWDAIKDCRQISGQRVFLELSNPEAVGLKRNLLTLLRQPIRSLGTGTGVLLDLRDLDRSKEDVAVAISVNLIDRGPSDEHRASSAPE